ncbi:MAG: hypothetical protein D3914_03395, partial [Candidatus Electrothrix sp. LOE2]|nr:hypothetical protein [Candidatus Electrothrix sp. LOE2]
MRRNILIFEAISKDAVNRKLTSQAKRAILKRELSLISLIEQNRRYNGQGGGNMAGPQLPVQLTVRSECVLSGTPEELRAVIREQLTVDNPKYLAAQRYSRWP